jgi:peptidyl-prolyl cis-trans isomerase C
MTSPSLQSRWYSALLGCCLQCALVEGATTGKGAWYLENIKVGPVELPVDTVTLVISVVALYIFASVFGLTEAKASCTASHILLTTSDEATKEKLTAAKEKIGADGTQFSAYAAEHSTCPSKTKGGLLGKFPQGGMVPPFDKVCFDPATPVGTTIGPVQTQFGYHLIYIHERTLTTKK